jgi:hypothetical protein
MIVSALNIDDVSLSNQAEADIRKSYESGRHAVVPKAGQLFELPYGDPRLIPKCEQWVFDIDDAALRIKPSDFPAKGWLLVTVALCVIAALFFGVALVISVCRQPLDWPVLFNRRTGKVIQMQGKQMVGADWAALRPFVERVYNAQGAPFWKLRLLQLNEAGAVEKNLVLKALAPGPEGCAAYFEYLRRYMQGQWEGIPDTLVVHGLRRSLLRQFRNDFGWMFGKKRAWAERPTWLKALTIVLMPVLTFVIWPFGFFVLLGSRAGWQPTFPADAEAQAQGGAMPPQLKSKIRQEPELAASERVLYAAIVVISTVIWAWLIFGYLGPFFTSLSQG